jgi:hypothetical protein
MTLFTLCDMVLSSLLTELGLAATLRQHLGLKPDKTEQKGSVGALYFH